MNKVLLSLRDRCSACLEIAGRDRILIALAGIPGSGKSTIAAGLCELINSDHAAKCTVIPMDGFHLSRRQLMEFPNHEYALARRGSPFTFDSKALVEAIRKLRESCFVLVDQRPAINFPSFSHELQDPVDSGITILPDCSIVIIEGLYLLLNDEPWCEIQELVDDTWFIDVPVETAAERLIKRHIRSGLENDIQSARDRVESNDKINALYILAHSCQARVHITSENVLYSSG